MALHYDYFGDVDVAPVRRRYPGLTPEEFEAFGAASAPKGPGFLSRNKGPLLQAGGSLLAGLFGEWAEANAAQHEKQFLGDVIQKSAIQPEQIATGLEQAVGEIRGRVQPDLPRQARQRGRQSQAVARAKTNLSNAGEVAMAMEGLESIQSAVSNIQSAQRNISRGRDTMIAGAMQRTGALKTQAAAGTAGFLREQSFMAAQRAAAAGDVWRQAVLGLVKMGAAIAVPGPSGALAAASGGYDLSQVG